VDGAGTNTRKSPTYVAGETILTRRLANLNSLFSFEIAVTSRCTSGLCVPEERSVTSGRDVCQRTVVSLATEGFDQDTARRLLRGLIGAGFVSKEHPGRGQGVISTYHLHLPPRRQQR
jgi:hypothetical protein